MFLGLILSVFFVEAKSPKDFAWQNRILIVQTADLESAWFQEKNEQALSDRKLLVFQFEGSVLVKSNFEEEIDAAKFLGVLDSKKGVSPRWVLIGLDGGVKHSGTQSPLPSEIYRLIDAMPMRQSEIRKSDG